MPGLMIFIIYSLLGNITRDKDYSNYSGVVVNKPSFFYMISNNDENWEEEDFRNINELKSRVQKKQLDILVVFPEEFDNIVFDSNTNKPEIEVYYNSSSEKSEMAYNQMVLSLDAYEKSLASLFTINSSGKDYDLANEKEKVAMTVSSILPMLLLMFLFTGCVSIGPESIAGEKERGTIATLLVTPISRKSIAIGKIAALSILALISGTISFLCTMASLPRAMNIGETIDMGIYSYKEYLALFLVIISTIMVMVGIVTCISAFAKNIKEASTISSPLILVIVVMSLSPNYINTESFASFFLPIINSSLCMGDIFKFSVNVENILLTVVTNCVFTVVLVVALAKMFESENLIYTK